MKIEEIKNQIDSLFSEIEKLKKEKSHHESKIGYIDNCIDKIKDKISYIRSKCTHTYLGNKPTHMGRGICKICGDNDY